MDKEDVVCVCICTCIYTYIEWDTTQPLKRIMPFAATGMDLEIIILSELSHKEKDKCHIISFRCRL